MNRRLRIGLVLTLVLIGTLSLSVLSAGASQGKLVMEWESTDLDGSHQLLTIIVGPTGNIHLNLYDDGASACGLDDKGSPLYAAKAYGEGGKSGGKIFGVLNVYCMANPAYFWGTANVEFQYNPATDTLTDTFGVVWHRR